VTIKRISGHTMYYLGNFRIEWICRITNLATLKTAYHRKREASFSFA
jgi:hypothetical protein